MNARSSTVGLIGLGLALALGIFLSAETLASAFLEGRRESQAFRVKGFAERQITSDFATWEGGVTTRAPTLAAASRLLSEQRDEVGAYLTKLGLAPAQIEFLPLTTQVVHRINENGRSTNEVVGYLLSQTVAVASTDIELVTTAAKGAADLVEKGIEMHAGRPQYLFTKLDTLKVEMLGEATADARRRAEVLATHSGGTIGPLVSAQQGVFQITPAFSTEVSDYGRNDTTSRDKSIKAVVTVRYAVAQ